MRQAERTFISVVMAAATLVVPTGFPLTAQDPPSTHQQTHRSAASIEFNFLVGSGLLCGADDSTACPVLARASDGETMEISGAGTLNPAEKLVSAAGAFSETLPSGIVVAMGVWTATQLVSFESFGLAPAALQIDLPSVRTTGGLPGGPATNLQANLLARPMPAGGVATIRIQLLPDVGAPREAVLQIICAKGQAPPDLSEGIKIELAAGGPEFDEAVSGRTLFFLRLPGPNREWRSAAVNKEP